MFKCKNCGKDLKVGTYLWYHKVDGGCTKPEPKPVSLEVQNNLLDEITALGGKIKELNDRLSKCTCLK